MVIPLRHFFVLIATAALLTAGAVAAVWLIGPEPQASEAAAPLVAVSENAGYGGLDARRIYDARAEGVVSVSTITVADTAVAGTGFLIDDKGHVLTNQHVIDSAARITVSIGPRDEAVVAELVGADRGTDLALLRIAIPSGVEVSPLPLGRASDLRVGDPVLAIGSPFGLDRTATVGIVSALGRQVTAPDGFPIAGVIQTDAAINHGNSGGPLLDRDGRVVGINTQIADSGVNANVGVAFAVPVELAARNVDRWLSGQQVGHAWMGVTATTLPAALADRLEVDGGVQIFAVADDSPAMRAGLKPAPDKTTIAGVPYASGGDVLMALDGRRLLSFDDLQEALGRAQPGDRITLEVMDGDRERRSVEMELTARPTR